MAGALVVCADCDRWCSTGGSPICGLCRVSRAVKLLPTDPRISSANYDLVTSILERAIGEVNTWLSVPLGEPPAAFEHRERATETNPSSNQHSGEHSPREDCRRKEKRRSRDIERREERRELRRQPPPPPPPPCRDHSTPPAQINITVSSKRKARSPNLPVAAEGHPVGDLEPDQVIPFGRCHKKNKGRKHRERGQAFRESHLESTATQPYGWRRDSDQLQRE